MSLNTKEAYLVSLERTSRNSIIPSTTLMIMYLTMGQSWTWEPNYFEIFLKINKRRSWNNHTGGKFIMVIQ